MLHRVTTNRENRKMSGNFAAAMEMLGISVKITEVSGENLVRENCLKLS